MSLKRRDLIAFVGALALFPAAARAGDTSPNQKQQADLKSQNPNTPPSNPSQAPKTRSSADTSPPRSITKTDKKK